MSHYIEITVEQGEPRIEFTCDGRYGDVCHKRHRDPDVEEWAGDDADLIDTDMCWAQEWWHLAGKDGLRVETEGVICRAPVNIVYDEGVSATPEHPRHDHPNPDDERQMTVASQAAYNEVPHIPGVSDSHVYADLADRIARAVLTALAAMGGDRT